MIRPRWLWLGVGLALAGCASPPRAERLPPDEPDVDVPTILEGLGVSGPAYFPPAAQPMEGRTPPSSRLAAGYSRPPASPAADRVSPPLLLKTPAPRPRPLAPPALDRKATPLPLAGKVSAAQRILEEAHRILDNAKNSTYTHRTKIDEDAGLYDLDCSGLVRYVLKQVSPPHLAAIASESRHALPLAAHFYEVFKDRLDAGREKDGWVGVPRAIDARPGDIIALRRKDPVPGNTGHVMIVAEPPVAESHNLVRVMVYDSSTSSAAEAPKDADKTGIGLRTKYLRVDAQGAPVAYGDGGRTHLADYPIAIGRAVGMAAKP